MGQNGAILKTINAGATWTTLSSGTSNWLSSVYFTNANIGYTVGNNGTILKTINGGANWSPLTSGTTKYLSSVCFTNANTGYAVGAEGTILKTINAGATWTTLSSGTSNGLSAIQFLDTNTGYVVGGLQPVEGTILKTINAGITWTALTIESNRAFNDVFFVNADRGYVIGGGHIYNTIDGGITWTDKMMGIGLYSIFFPNSDTGYMVGSDGTILKTTNGGGLPVGINENPLPSESLKIYPNPSNSAITIELQNITTPNRNTYLTIFNINGQVVSRRQLADTQTVVDVAGLPQGIYLVRVISDYQVFVGKMMKQ